MSLTDCVIKNLTRAEKNELIKRIKESMEKSEDVLPPDIEKLRKKVKALERPRQFTYEIGNPPIKITFKVYWDAASGDDMAEIDPDSIQIKFPKQYNPLSKILSKCIASEFMPFHVWLYDKCPKFQELNKEILEIVNQFYKYENEYNGFDSWVHVIKPSRDKKGR